MCVWSIVAGRAKQTAVERAVVMCSQTTHKICSVCCVAPEILRERTKERIRVQDRAAPSQSLTP